MSGLGRVGPEFEEFVRESSSGLLRLAFLLTRDRGAAEDLVQLCLVRTAGQWSSAQEHPLGYARRVLVNLAKNRWRDRAHRPTEAELTADLDRVEQSAEDRVAQRDAMSRLLTRLPARQRAALVLRYFEDLPVREVAAILGCSEGNVKSQTSRALATLRSLLDPTASETPRETRHAHR